MMINNAFYQIALLLLIAVFIGSISFRFKQPLILSFIIVGVLAGPSGFDWIHSSTEIALLSEIGITLLLFVVGLKLDIKLIHSLGFVSLAIGCAQIVITTLLAYVLSLGLGLSNLSAIYVALALTFSSTIIIVKALSDNDELDSLYGRISLGVLILQDIVVIFAIIVISSFGSDQVVQSNILIKLLTLISTCAFLITGIIVLSKYIFPSFLNSLASSRELLVLFTLTWAIALAVLCEKIGLSKEVGGFLAGFSLASLPYRDAIASRLETLRNFLLLFFFIELGSNIQLDWAHTQIMPTIILSAFVLIVKPLILMVIIGFAGYKKRTGFLTGISLAQVSEFSFIFAALGVHLGAIDQQTLGLITLSGIITIGISTYVISYNQNVYKKLSRFLKVFEKANPYREAPTVAELNIPKNVEFVVFGLGRYGLHLMESLQELGLSGIGVDFDPQKVDHWNNKGGLAWYGDIDDIDLLKSIPMDQIRCIVTTIRHRESNLILLQALKEYNYHGMVAMTVYSDHDYHTYQHSDLNLMLMPYKDAAYFGAQNVANLLKIRR